jgi:hypothetical protein
MIVGSGNGTSFSCNNVTPLFTAVGNYTSFQNLKTDAGGISMGATTGWIWYNVNINGTVYTEKTPNSSLVNNTLVLPTGRTASWIFAASDSPTDWKSQADRVLTGTADQALINSDLASLPSDVTFAPGDYNLTGSIIPQGNVIIHGQAHTSAFHFSGSFHAFQDNGNYTESNVTIQNIYIVSTTPANGFACITFGEVSHQSTNVHLLNVEANGGSLNISFSTNSSVEGCFVYNVASAADRAIGMDFGTNNKILNNQISTCASSMMINAGLNNGIEVSNNMLMTHTGAGFAIDCNTSSPCIVSNNTLNGVNAGINSENASNGIINIINNAIVGNNVSTSLGIQCWRTSATPTASSCVITGNSISTTVYAIGVNDFLTAAISNNFITNCTSGIVVSNTVAWSTPMTALTISTNQILNSAQGSNQSAIIFDTGTTAIGDIVFNTITSTNGANGRGISYANYHTPNSMVFNSISGVPYPYVNQAGNSGCPAIAMLTNLPTSSAGLATGQLWSNSGVITVH